MPVPPTTFCWFASRPVNINTLKTDDIHLIKSDMRIVRLELTYAVRLSTDPAFSSSRTVTRLLAYDDAVSSP